MPLKEMWTMTKIQKRAKHEHMEEQNDNPRNLVQFWGTRGKGYEEQFCCQKTQ